MRNSSLEKGLEVSAKGTENSKNSYTTDNGGRKQKNIQSRVTWSYLAKGHLDLLISNP